MEESPRERVSAARRLSCEEMAGMLEKVLFWTSLGAVIYTYLGYPVFVTIMAAFIKKPAEKKEFYPALSLLIPVFNEEKMIREKIENVLSLDYPPEKMEVLVASDGSTDRTNEIVENFSDKGVKLVKYPGRRGKISVLNDTLPEAKGEIIVFTDAHEMFEKGALKELVFNFYDPQVGCVSGCHRLYRNLSSVGKGASFYWRYERYIQAKESMIDSILSCDGTIFALRKRLYQPQPAWLINDDDAIPLSILLQGHRVVSEPKAVAVGSGSTEHSQELNRRARFQSGHYQIFSCLEGLWNPFRNRLFFQYISHKVLRVLTPFLILIIFCSNLFLLSRGLFYRVSFVLETLFYLCGLVGYILQIKKINFPVFYIFYYFCLHNIAGWLGFYRFIRGSQKVTWEKVRVS